MISSLTVLALLCYVLTAACYGASLFLHAPASPLLKSESSRPTLAFFGRPLLFLGIALQFAAIGVWCATTHRSPFASEFGTLSVSAWGIAIVFALMDLRRKLPALGALALAVASLLLLRGLLLLRAPVTEAQIIANRLVSLHVLAILFSFALFVIAFGAAVLYLVQNRLLKQRQIGGLFRRLPPLETLDRTAYHSVAYALPLLTLGITLGFVQVMTASPKFSLSSWFSDAHTVMSLGAWLLYVFYLAARLASGWRGIRLQYVLIFGLAVVLSLYIMPTSMHHFP